ncbi:MAG: hypothetical protein WCI27_10795, partial [Candidatus Omnitrophota bacterium]
MGQIFAVAKALILWTLCFSVPLPSANAYNDNAPELLTNGNAESSDMSNFPGWTRTQADAAGGIASLEKIGSAVLYSQQAIAVDMNKRYFLSARVKSAGSGGLSNIYVGLAPLDKDRNFITPRNYYQPGPTQTILTRELKNGDTKAYVQSVA